MSGGSLNYLCYKEPEELFHYLRELEEVEQELLTRGAQDVARDVRRLIEYIKSAEIRISILSEQLNPIFRAVEWRLSADIGDDSLLKVIEEYRADKEEPKQ
jgi:SPX domain protein involved in polyphosphate accumulation